MKKEMIWMSSIQSKETKQMGTERKPSFNWNIYRSSKVELGKKTAKK